MNRIIALALGVLLSVSQAFATPLEEVKKTVDDVVKIVADKGGKNNEKKRRQALKRTISAIFDYSEMSKRSLGKQWNQLAQEEKVHFAGLFAELLENSYAGKIESYNNEKIVYVKELFDGDHAEIKSKVVTAKRDEFTLDYRMMRQNGKWMVYDVVIEGVSLVSNYRSQFGKIIKTSGYDGLVKKLEAKNSELKAL